MHIGPFEITGGSRVFVIAEAGVNHNGNVDAAMLLVDAALFAGADAVKFQMFTPSEMVVAAAPATEYQKAAGCDSQHDLLQGLALSPVDFRRIARHCHDRGIIFLATPFSEPDLQELLALNPPAIKIASTDLNNAPLLEAAARTGLPLLMSTGASTEHEIADALAVIDHAIDQTVLLHCVSCYPAADADGNLRRIAALAERFELPVGYSDHTTGEIAGALAVAAGARIIEKHLTLDRSQSGPDHGFSLDPPAMQRYVAAIRHAERLCGDGSIDFAPCEADVRAKARKSIVTRRDIRAGQRITSDLVALKRPGGGIAPDRLEAVVGRTAAAELAADTVLAWEHLQ